MPDDRCVLPSRHIGARYLYGDSTGRWLMIEGPTGVPLPSKLDGMYRFGTLTEVFGQALALLSEDSPRGGMTRLACALGVDLPTLSVALRRGSVPAMTSDAWSILVRYLCVGDERVFPPPARLGRPRRN